MKPVTFDFATQAESSDVFSIHVMPRCAVPVSDSCSKMLTVKFFFVLPPPHVRSFQAAGGSKGDVGAYSEDEAEPTSKRAKTTADGAFLFVHLFTAPLNAYEFSILANEDPNLTKVRGWRHKLQKIFLNEKVPIPAAVRFVSSSFYIQNYLNMAVTYRKWASVTRSLKKWLVSR